MTESYNDKKTKPRSKDWNYGGPRWRLSRSKIDLFTECRRCFYIDNKLGIARPRGPAFTLNIAVDELLKKEFDMHRSQKSPHPLMDSYGIDAVPFADKKMEVWRDNFQGIEHVHSSGLTICGAVDDVWINKDGELIVVDYKATAKAEKIEKLENTKWENQYKKQIEIYIWLLRQNGYKVSDTGYFVYVNGKKDREAFDGKLDFDVTVIPHTGKTDWIEGVIKEIKEVLDSDVVPEVNPDCEFCNYIKNIENTER